MRKEEIQMVNEKWFLEILKAVNLVFLKDVPEEMKDNLENLYKKNIETQYLSLIEKIDSLEKFNKVLEYIVRVETELWGNASLEGKLSYLVKDAAYNDLNALSLKIFQLARERQEKQLILSDAEQNQFRKQLDDLLSKVMQMNQNRAKILYSEALLDLNYAYGLSEFTSLRLGSYNK